MLPVYVGMKLSRLFFCLIIQHMRTALQQGAGDVTYSDHNYERCLNVVMIFYSLLACMEMQEFNTHQERVIYSAYCHM